ncbi:holo-ACP synthase [Micropruina sp.]|uniref:holo-ACP synthase n=1 Tax=Micropruina sp. TaxID=2737536 RepID=UPI0039E2DCB8
MIVGIGIDVCPVERFASAAARERLLARLFTPAERDSSMNRMAGRFAAKEALAKALGAPAGLSWHDVEVRKDDLGKPYFHYTGTIADRVAALGIATVHLSITHDAGIAAAVVVCEA